MSIPFIHPDWPAPPNVRALQTTRSGGISGAPYTSLNLGTHVGDAPLVVARNRNSLNAVLPSEPVWLEQIHGTRVANADAANCREIADACIATKRGAVCVVMTADCLPILLCDTRGTVVAAVHAGWKGLAAGVIEATVQAMCVDGAQLMTWLGPAISSAAFEVGAEIREIFVAQNPAARAAFTPSEREFINTESNRQALTPSAPNTPSEKFHADLYALARLRLRALGITQIYGGDRCTHTESDTFFSYRRDGVTGRMATFIWLE
ncbi:MAG: peptidoglycan editing factor PgeF [Gallionella sp.]